MTILAPGNYLIELEFQRPVEFMTLFSVLERMGFVQLTPDDTAAATAVGALALSSSLRRPATAPRTTSLRSSALTSVATAQRTVAPAPAPAPKPVAAPLPKPTAPTTSPTNSIRQQAMSTAQQTISRSVASTPTVERPPPPKLTASQQIAAQNQGPAFTKAPATASSRVTQPIAATQRQVSPQQKAPPAPAQEPAPAADPGYSYSEPAYDYGGGYSDYGGGYSDYGGGGGGDGGGEGYLAESTALPPDADGYASEEAPATSQAVAPPSEAVKNAAGYVLDLWRRWVEWGSPFASGPRTSGLDEPIPYRFRFIATLVNPLRIEDKPGMQWLYVRRLGLNPFGDLEFTLKPFRLRRGATYELRFLSRARSMPTREDVKKGLAGMGFAPMKLSVMKRNMRVPGRAGASVTLWYAIAAWERGDTVITHGDPFFFLNAKEIQG